MAMQAGFFESRATLYVRCRTVFQPVLGVRFKPQSEATDDPGIFRRFHKGLMKYKDAGSAVAIFTLHYLGQILLIDVK